MNEQLTEKQWLTIGGVAVAGLALFWLSESRRGGLSLPLGPLVNPMTIRVDTGGDGHYGSVRVGHPHHGIDVLCRPGQSVYAPFTGTVTREALPYPDDTRWRGLVIESDTLNCECKLFYCIPAQHIVGRHVERGQLIGYCQGISKRYGPAVHDHLHLEIRQNSKLLNPETLFTFS